MSFDSMPPSSENSTSEQSRERIKQTVESFLGFVDRSDKAEFHTEKEGNAIIHIKLGRSSEPIETVGHELEFEIPVNEFTEVPYNPSIVGSEQEYDVSDTMHLRFKVNMSDKKFVFVGTRHDDDYDQEVMEGYREDALKRIKELWSEYLKGQLKQ